MKLQRLSLLTVLFTALLLSNLPATAQPPGGRSPGGRGREGARPGDSGGGRRGPGMGPGGQQTPPFVRIFDADGDGELSAKEIDNAANALRKLDKNRDGKLTSGELRPAPGGQGRGPGGMQGGRPGGGRPGGERPGGGRPGGERPGGGRPGGSGGGRGGDPAQADAAFAESLMEFDSNKDGVLSQDELPGHMHDAFAKSDINKDGSLNKEERLGLASHFRRNKLNPEGGEPVNAPTQGQRPGAGGQRPGAGGQRPGAGGQRPGGGAAQGARTRPRDRVRPRDTEFNDKFPVGSELPADLKVYSADRKLAPVKSLLKAKYTVIVGGCLTCPEFRNSYPEIEAVARDFAGKDVDFYFVYQALTHPENWGYVQPSSIEDRFAQVEHAKQLLKTRISWLTDPMDNQMKSHFVITPNSQFLFDKSGKIVHRSSWARGSSLRETLEKLVGRPATYTTVEALKLPRFERHLTPQSEMLVERVRVEGVAVPLRVASGGKSNLVSALRSTDFSEDNRYVKLRPEADQQLINTGTGKLYLGFRQDPVLGAKWNNLATPPKYKITAKSAAFSPATGESPKLKVDSDKEPREFLVDVKNWKAGEPISVEIQYFACNNEKGWCKPVQQEFTVWLDKDGLAGMVNGRSHFPGGRGGGRQGAGGRGRPGEGQRPGGQRPGGQRPGQRD